MNGPPTKVLPPKYDESDSLVNASDIALIMYHIKICPEM